MALRWRSIDPCSSARLSEVLKSWEKTPYAEGQRVKRMGADCVQLVVGILDELFRTKPPTVVPSVPVDAAIHSDESALPSLRVLRTAWFGSEEVKDGTIEPGDVVLTRAEANPAAPLRPAHAMIVGVEPWTALHTLRGMGARFSTIEATRGIVKVYRVREKEQWAALSPFTMQ